ncbi:NAD(P)/FAD-dependent oxidoreductase, partial [bacterium AH-315-N03]|nr:NAD(P)/FAD-dependent oxidoreductase [bacterium AH-315-N03]
MIADVAICGGGLAGLTLALQLRQRAPGASLVVLESSRRPLPEGCHKVGESTVEIGARYLGHVLGLHDYLLDRHLPKNGLRFFCGAPGAPIEQRSEMGPREAPRVPAYQLDRGRLENDLRERCVEKGIDLREGWGVRNVEIGSPHRITAVETRTSGDPVEIAARWVIDATGRRRLLAKKLGLHEDVTPQAHAAWFRVQERVLIQELAPAAAQQWHDRDIDGNRWLSTNHLCGYGYWVWLIPLENGVTSIGLVTEAACHDYGELSTEEALRAWIAAHEPALSARLEGVAFADFIAMKDYRHSASRVLSAERWACVGEAGIFIDPLYSPGSDFIALANTYTTELVVDDLAGRLDPQRVDAFDAFFRDWATLIARTTVLGSRTMRSAEVLAAKLYWDFFYYWAFMCPYYFSECWALGPDDHERFHGMLRRFTALNERAQTVTQAWTDLAESEPSVPFVGLPAIATTLSDLHLALLEKTSVDATYDAMERALGWGEELVTELLLRALRRAGESRA